MNYFQILCQYALIYFAILPSFVIAQNSGEWIEHWIAGSLHSQAKEYEVAKDDYTRAIGLLGQQADQQLQLYNERALIYTHMGQYEKAISDYSEVIEKASSTHSDAMTAWWGRLFSYAKLNDLEHCENHYKVIREVDPLFPEINFSGDCMIVKSRQEFTEQERVRLAEAMVETGICKNTEDTIFTSPGICVIQCGDFLNKYFRERQGCIQCDQSRSFFSRKDPHKIEKCKEHCASAAYYAGLACTRLPKACSFICFIAIEPLRRACNWCCDSGDFFQTCVDPLVRFFPPPCDPAWEN